MDQHLSDETSPGDAACRFLFFLAWLGVLGGTLALYAASLLLGDLNQDEGWYLYAARLVSEGRLPYIDFASTQGPVMPFVYALGNPLVRLLGVAGGRLFTALLGLAATILAAVLAPRLASSGRARPAASSISLLAFALVGVNVYHCYFTTVVKTYSLTAVFLMLGFLCLTCVGVRRRALPAFLSGLFIMLAAATRTSAGAAMPFAWLYLLCGAPGGGAQEDVRTQDRPGPSWRGAFAAPSCFFVLGAALTALCVFGPFLLLAPRGVWFALVEYHSGRSAGGLLSALAYKAGFVARTLHAYTAAVAVGLLGVVHTLREREERVGHAPCRCLTRAFSLLAPRSPVHAAWLAVAAVSLLHLVAPFPYDDYQTIVYPLAVAALAASWGGGCATCEGRRVETLAIVLFVFLMAFASPLIQGWFVGERDRIWWPLKQETPLSNLRHAGQMVKTLAGPRGEVLTQDTYLAVEAGLHVPAGLELGPFSYFPDWADAKAASLHVLNRDGLRKLLNGSTAQVAAFSGYGLAIGCPSVTELSTREQRELWTLVDRRYSAKSVIPRFGQAATDLKVLVRNTESPEHVVSGPSRAGAQP